jgi:uncharacterized membrane protein SirB2
MYVAVKYLHVACVIVSISGFFVRGLLMLANVPIPCRGWWRWAPHVNDSVLLAAAIGLAVMGARYPIVEPWLTAKLVGLIIYIALGAVALKPAHRRSIRLGAWLGALAMFSYMVSVAIAKSPWGFLAPLWP